MTCKSSRDLLRKAALVMCLSLAVLACTKRDESNATIKELDRLIKEDNSALAVDTIQANPVLVHSRNDYGDTPLILASYEGDRMVVNALIEQGADLDVANEAGTTALAAAAMRGHTGVLRDLLAAGANPNVGNGAPLHWAVVASEKEAVRILLQAGADPLLENQHNKTAIDVADEQEIDTIALILREALEKRSQEP